MESIEAPGTEHLRCLTEADLPAALALSAAAHWNQTEADWRALLGLGQGWGIEVAAPRGETVLAASTVVLPYGADFAWVSMVLVLPSFRRRGFARRLLQQALLTLHAQGRTAVLDATPAGHAVYAQAGFADSWGFTRLVRSAQPALAHVSAARQQGGLHTRPLLDADWPAIAALDLPAFGASRLPLLKHLAQRLPRAARVFESGGRITGYVLARDGHDAAQLGPLVAPHEAAAAQLLTDALPAVPGPVFVDLPDTRPTLLAFLQRQCFVPQRPFTRMVLGRKKAPGEAGAVMLVAGPELG